jgi:hypothetical protein
MLDVSCQLAHVARISLRYFVSSLVCWTVTPCGLIGGYCFGGTYFLCLHGCITSLYRTEIMGCLKLEIHFILNMSNFFQWILRDVLICLCVNCQTPCISVLI